MPEPTQGNPLEAFGANEWLVDEMYEQYQRDPESVDRAWWDFFKTYGNGAAPADAAAEKPAAAATAQATATKPAPPAAETAPKAEPKAAPASSQAASPQPASTNGQKPAPAAAPAAKSSAPAASSKPVPKEPVEPKAAEASDEPTFTVLRGAPARTVQNMDASLTVPTATSVRQVPVKLLWDNRIVINNHLARARGGKVSFTHLIGFALVKALRSMPEMNVGFDVIDGKPTLVTPAHINLGLAIDLPKPDGTRQLLVPSIKAAESMDFAHF